MGAKQMAYAQFIAAVLVWGTIGVVVRYLPLPSSVIACGRGLIGAAVLLVVLLVSRGGTARRPAIEGAASSPRPHLFRFERREIPLMVATGIAIGINWMLLFEAYRHTTVAVATLCYYFAPLIVVLGSVPVLGERLTGRKLACVAVATAGVVFVSGVLDPGGAEGSWLGVAFGLAAAVFYGANMLMNKLTPRTDPLDKTVLQLACAGGVMIPYVAATVDVGALEWTPLAVGLLLLLGVFHTGVTYRWFFASMRVLPAQTLAVLSYLDPACAIVLSAVVLAEPLGPLGLLGAVLILGAALASELRPQGRKSDKGAR